MAAGLAAPTFVRMGWGTAFVDADLDGKLDLFFANGHIFADIESYPQLGETYRQKNQLLLNLGTRFRDVSERAGGGLQVARVGRGLAVGDLDDDGDLDLVVSNMDDAPTLLENRQRTGHHWVAFRVVGARRKPIRDRREGDDRRRRRESRCARSARAGASSRRAICARTSAWAITPARWTWRSACRAAPLAMASTARRSPARARALSVRQGAAGQSRTMNPSTARQKSCVAVVVAGLAIALAGVGGAARVTEARAVITK